MLQAVRAFAELTLRFGPGTNVVAALLRVRARLTHMRADGMRLADMPAL